MQNKNIANMNNDHLFLGLCIVLPFFNKLYRSTLSNQVQLEVKFYKTKEEA